MEGLQSPAMRSPLASVQTPKPFGSASPEALPLKLPRKVLPLAYCLTPGPHGHSAFHCSTPQVGNLCPSPSSSLLLGCASLYFHFASPLSKAYLAGCFGDMKSSVTLSGWHCQQSRWRSLGRSHLAGVVRLTVPILRENVFPIVAGNLAILRGDSLVSARAHAQCASIAHNIARRC